MLSWQCLTLRPFFLVYNVIVSGVCLIIKYRSTALLQILQFHLQIMQTTDDFIAEAKRKTRILWYSTGGQLICYQYHK